MNMEMEGSLYTWNGFRSWAVKNNSKCLQYAGADAVIRVQLMFPLSLKGHLVPSDEITVYYTSEPAGDYLDKVIHAHSDFIFTTTKAPLKPYPVPKDASVIIQEKTQVNFQLLFLKYNLYGQRFLNLTIAPICACWTYLVPDLVSFYC